MSWFSSEHKVPPSPTVAWNANGIPDDFLTRYGFAGNDNPATGLPWTLDEAVVAEAAKRSGSYPMYGFNPKTGKPYTEEEYRASGGPDPRTGQPYPNDPAGRVPLDPNWGQPAPTEERRVTIDPRESGAQPWGGDPRMANDREREIMAAKYAANPNIRMGAMQDNPASGFTPPTLGMVGGVQRKLTPGGLGSTAGATGGWYQGGRQSPTPYGENRQSPTGGYGAGGFGQSGYGKRRV